MLDLMIQKPWAFTFALVAALAFTAMPDLAAAGTVTTTGGGAGSNTIANVLCKVVGWFTGSIGKGIATLAIIIIGIGALMGKVSWGMAIIVGIGVAVIFGAGSIVSELGHSGSSTCVDKTI